MLGQWPLEEHGVQVGIQLDELEPNKGLDLT